ncbi:MAG: hypothetical protein ABI960_08905 [Candidatus Eisenbacteria bacterium]
MADDYDYLHALRFERPLDLLGPMGSLWYWRPLSRQAYFALLEGPLFQAPLVVAGLHLLLLAALFALAYRAARRGFDPLGAAAIAAFPLLAEPTRALLSWPTGAQPLLAMVLIALALHETLARRAWTAWLALAGALLSHEQALLAVPVLPWAFAHATRDPGARRRFAFGTIALAALYGIARWIAFDHGAGLPARSAPAEALAAAPGVWARSLAAQFDLATLDGDPRRIVLALQLALALSALALCLRRDVRARLRARAAAMVAGGAWFALGILPLAFAAALWTPRHTSLPALGLGLAVCGLLACAAPRLALAFTAVRLAALLLAPTAPLLVSERMSAQASPMSFLHLARMQRTVDSARRVLTAAHPTLPGGTQVHYWSLPRETQVAFAGSRAVEVWYADSTLRWTFWQRERMNVDVSRDPILGFNVRVPDPAVLMRPIAVRHYQDAVRSWASGDLWPAQQRFFEALHEQRPPVHNFTNETVRLMARIAYARGSFERADSLNHVDYEMSGETPTYFGMAALLAAAAGDSARAVQAAERCLRLRPNDDEALAVLQALRPRGAGSSL